jgi:flagellar protein FlgJ
VKFARNGRARTAVLAVAAGAAVAVMTASPAMAAAAPVASDTVRTGGTPLNVRASAKSASPLVGRLNDGAVFTIVCQVIGEKVTGTVRTTVAWDRLTNGAYVSDAYVQHPAKRVFTRCAAGKSAPVLVPPVPAPKAGLSLKAATFLTGIAPAARQGDREYGVPSSVTMAQAILESGWGSSKLTANDNNYFGIKCFGTPGAIAVSCHRYVTNECDKVTKKCWSTTATFRVYKTVTDSFRDHAVFLANGKRYQPAFGFMAKPDLFAAAIHKAGYATDPNYTTKLVNLMKQYDLYRYDV